MVAARFSTFLRAARLIYAAAPRWTLAWGLLLAAQGLLPVGTVALTRRVVDALAAGLRPGASWEALRPALAPAALLAAALLLAGLLGSVGEWVRAAQAELIKEHILGLVHEKSVSVDLVFYERPDYLDRLYQVSGEAASRPLALLESAGGVAQNALTLAGICLVLLPYGPWLPLALAASALPALFVVLRHKWRYHRWWERSTQDRRWAQYYDFMLTGSFGAAELRLFGLGPHFQAAYRELAARLRTERLRLARDGGLARLAAGGLSLAVSGAALAWAVLRAFHGGLTLGDLTLLYQSFQRGGSLAGALLGSLGQIYSSSLFLGNLFEFLDLQPQVADPPEPLPAPAALEQGIRFRGVTFSYPGAARPALQDFDLSIPAGRVVAIVGENGAGKSTLVKLLCRFYDPQQGSVELDGADLRSMRVEELRRRVTVLFQNPVTYHASAAGNIALGDLPAGAGRAEVEAAARSAGAHAAIARLPQGYDTLLGRWFVDGAELSAGEWQRVALARAYLRRAPILVLDEPTSAMDSWSEADWFDRLRRLAHGRTAVVITHRFTIALRADLICVMHQGRIVETGTHAELLARRGRYAQSWSAQMRAAQEPILPPQMQPTQEPAWPSTHPTS
jgi:ATP-binding cassette subfamily B protein